MPVNAPLEYYKAEEKFLRAKSIDEKISALEEMIRYLPKHKGSENLLALLRRRLARLKEEKKSKKKIKKFSGPVVKKEGAAQICIIGFTNSGKSTLLKYLTKKNVEISEKPYTTKKPEIGMMNYKGIKIQVVELPSTFEGYIYGVLNNCDLILVLIDALQDIRDQKMFFETLIRERKWEDKVVFVCTKGNIKGCIRFEVKEESVEELKKLIWKKLGLIRIFTKPPGKEPEKEAITFKGKVKVRDVCKKLGESFIRNFKFARVFDNSPFSGRRVGLDYKLKDGDIVEIHVKA